MNLSARICRYALRLVTCIKLPRIRLNNGCILICLRVSLWDVSFCGTHHIQPLDQIAFPYPIFRRLSDEPQLLSLSHSLHRRNLPALELIVAFLSIQVFACTDHTDPTKYHSQGFLPRLASLRISLSVIKGYSDLFCQVAI